MASPQRENGFTGIAHEIIHALIKAHLSRRQWEVVMLLLRESYGHNRKEAILSYGEIARRTEMQRPHAVRTMQSLVDANLVTPTSVTKGGTSDKNVYRFQKDYLQWGSTKVGTATTIGTRSSTTGGNTPIKVVKEEKRNTPTVRPLSDSLTSKRNDVDPLPDPSPAAPTLEVERCFELAWAKYPEKDGQKDARKHFKRSVKSEEDWQRFQKALTNYLASDRVKRGFIKNGSTFFNNWEDWVDREPEAAGTSGKSDWFQA